VQASSSIKLLTLLVLSLLVASSSHAETSEWMNGYDSFRFGNKLGREGMLVTRLECKDGGKVSLDYDSALVRLTYEKNTKKIPWLFTGWTNLQEVQRHYEGKGYQLVQHTMFRRQKTGLRLFCVLFYKN
jgi:hypothetical protein